MLDVNGKVDENFKKVKFKFQKQEKSEKLNSQEPSKMWKLNI